MSKHLIGHHTRELATPLVVAIEAPRNLEQPTKVVTLDPNQSSNLPRLLENIRMNDLISQTPPCLINTRKYLPISHPETDMMPALIPIEILAYQITYVLTTCQDIDLCIFKQGQNAAD